MTKSIITNSRVGIGMSDLEARARSGCPIAQMEMTKRCMQAEGRCCERLEANWERYLAYRGMLADGKPVPYVISF